MKKKIIVTAAMILAALSLAAQSVKVVSPNGGESWALNSAQSITWTSTNPGSVKVDIVLRRGSVRVGAIKSQVALAAGSWTDLRRPARGRHLGPGRERLHRAHPRRREHVR